MGIREKQVFIGGFEGGLEGGSGKMSVNFVCMDLDIICSLIGFLLGGEGVSGEGCFDT